MSLLFWGIACAMCVVALALIVVPLRRGGSGDPVVRDTVNGDLYRERFAELAAEHRSGALGEADYREARGELERALLADTPTAPAPAPRRAPPWVAPLLLVLVPALAVGLYRYLGDPAALGTAVAATPAMDMPPGHPVPAGGAMAGSMDVMAARLAARLARDPNDAAGWALLGRSYAWLHRDADAASAFARARALGYRGPGGAARTAAAAPPAAPTVAPASHGDADAMLADLRRQLQAHPEDADRWALLGRSLAALGRYPEAADAYARATGLRPADAGLWAERADALAAAHGRRLAGEPEGFVTRALKLDPDQPKALWLAGTAALERGDRAGALARWRHLQTLLAPGSEPARMIAANIAELGGAPTAVPAPAAGVRLRGRVTLDPALAARLRPGDTLFIFARASNGPPMPLAILKRRAGDLPMDFELDDSMAMNPALRLSAFPAVVVGARVSRSGNAMPAAGDLEGYSGVVRPAAGGTVHIVINHEVS